jgi:hypothetical protein
MELRKTSQQTTPLPQITKYSTLKVSTLEVCFSTGHIYTLRGKKQVQQHEVLMLEHMTTSSKIMVKK